MICILNLILITYIDKMASLSTPQSQAGVINFYDAQTKGPKVDPRVFLIIVAAFVIAVLVLNHFMQF